MLGRSDDNEMPVITDDPPPMNKVIETTYTVNPRAFALNSRFYRRWFREHQTVGISILFIKKETPQYPPSLPYLISDG